ncbi:hypothetical protein OPT61_g2196 [Boeremia exigua]|uniref:Uncharacterized protein n=1 Tax=Boeremia exigua TaxID=749465 RepID=A0ACC2IMB5_9PLEO|nr:hypothetical protein OPT61_g2196 [Boeremia exigua]
MPGQANDGVWSAKRVAANKGLSCGADDGKAYASSKGDFKIVCGKDYVGNDLPATSAPSFEACIETCATTDRCVDVSYVGSTCYLKYAVVTASDSPQVWTAVRADAQPFVYGLTCDGNKDDKKVYAAKSGGSYTVECGVDYWGGDLSSVQTATFEACMDACDATTGCIDVSFSSGTCYMKNTLNSASPASWVWTGRKTLEVPLDLTQTIVNGNTQPADTQITKAPNLFSQTLSGTNPNYGLSTMLWFPTIPYTVYEISFEYYQDPGNSQVSFVEVGDSQGMLATTAWFQDREGTAVLGGPNWGVAMGGTVGGEMNACWNSKSEPQITPASGSWQTGTLLLYTRTDQGYFRRDNGGFGTQQWRNVFLRQKTDDYCGVTRCMGRTLLAIQTPEEIKLGCYEVV